MWIPWCYLNRKIVRSLMIIIVISDMIINYHIQKVKDICDHYCDNGMISIIPIFDLLSHLCIIYILYKSDRKLNTEAKNFIFLQYCKYTNQILSIILLKNYVILIHLMYHYTKYTIAF